MNRETKEKKITDWMREKRQTMHCGKDKGMRAEVGVGQSEERERITLYK